MELVNGKRYSQEDKALVFIYDTMMLKEQQKILEVNMQFVSFAYAKGKLYNISKRKKMERFVLTNRTKTLEVVYGAIFLVSNWEWDKMKLCSFYSNSIPYSGETLDSDLFDLVSINVVPIKFNSIEEFVNLEYKVLEPIDCLAFVENKENEYVKKRANFRYKSKYYDKSSFYKKIIELN